METLNGKLLIAVPQLPDENFFRSVVLILRHNQDGALGLILNRPSPISVDRVWSAMFGDSIELTEPIYVGGPVEGPLIALTTRMSLADESVLPGVFFTINREYLETLVSENQPPFKVFTGHSGWGPGQLESEIEAGGWFVIDATFEHIFESTETVWKELCDQHGRNILNLGRIDTASFNDPLMN